MLRLGTLRLALPLLLLASAADAQVPPPNFVLIVTDDQRFDSLQHMPLTLAALSAQGVTFSRAFVTNPVCAPSRASLLSGGHVSHSTGVVDNVLPNGGVSLFDDTPSLATALQGAGYATGLFGKYMNEYSGPAIPPGWTRFEAALGIALGPTSYVVGSSTALPGAGTYSPIITTYGTNHLRDRAIDFIDQHASEPFFLYLPLAAPHTPALPAPGDETLFPGYVYRERGYGEDVSDKPMRVQIASSAYPAYAPTDDALHRDQLRTLQAVDRAVDAIVDHLEQANLLANTVILYTSDNGYLWGEHGLVGKGEAYEESLRVPLVVVAPGVAPATDERLVAMNLDVPATLLDLAGVPHFGDGMSLAPLLANPALPGRTSTLVEGAQQWRVYAGLTVDDAVGRWKYVEDSSGDRELYDLDTDPYELSNVANAPEHQALIASLSAQLASQKGLAIKPRFVPPPLPGQPYLLQLQRWGGVPPFTWSVDSGQLPAGLSLDAETGLISGVAATSAGGSALIRVRDSSTNTQTGQPQSYGQSLLFASAVPACSDGVDNDQDGAIDLADAGCASAADVSEQISGLGCDDGSDNDLDGLVDLADPGCESPYDSLETTNATACDDGVDNEGDGFVDTHDPGCTAPDDASEHTDSPGCDDGLDDDADGFFDLADPGCSGITDPNETTPELVCDDGIDNDGDGRVDAADAACPNPTDGPEGPVCDDGDDNDGDGKVDYPTDLGCSAPWDSVENPECDDGIDNDNDTRIDWLDPQCTPSNVVRERRLSQCGLGAELLLALAVLRVLRRRTRLGSGALAAVALVLGQLVAGALPARAQATPPNVVVFLTDDQRFDTLWAMPLVQQELVARGVVFDQAFVTTPMCCPSRAGFLAGGWLAQETGVVDNAAPNGGFAKFHDADSLALAFQGAGYATGLVGKYLNGYEQAGPYVPPGWTLWHAALGIALGPTQYRIGSSTNLPGVGTLTPTIHQYGTDYLRDRALDFVDSHASEPFFLYLAFGAPHTPAQPANADLGLFSGYLYRGRAHAEADVSDKPLRVQVAATQFPAIAAGADAFHRDQLRTLQAVDRAVKALVDRLVALDLLDDTILVFTSDNGYLWGEHNLIGKGESYEESVRVPLVVVAPGIAPRSDAGLVAANLDLAATLRELTGLPPIGDGESLVPLLENPGLPGRSEALIEQVQPWRVWSGLRVREPSGDWKYVEDSSGASELYDLAADPYEEQNLASHPGYQTIRAVLSARLAPKKGLAITTTFVMPYMVGQPYSFAIQSWGVRGTPTWSIAQGDLPPGLTLDSATGVVSGTTTQVQPTAVLVRLEDSAVSPQSGLPYRYDQSLVFGPPACSDGIDNDLDTKVDLLDPGCDSATDASETTASNPCDDAIDNDVDGKTDFADPGCGVAPYDKESRNPACGLGIELPLALAGMGRLRTRSRT